MTEPWASRDCYVGGRKRDVGGGDSDMGGRDCNVAGCGSGSGIICRSCAVDVWDCNAGGDWKGRDHLGGNWDGSWEGRDHCRPHRVSCWCSEGCNRGSKNLSRRHGRGRRAAVGTERVPAWATARGALCSRYTSVSCTTPAKF